MKRYNEASPNTEGRRIHKSTSFLDCVNKCETESTCMTATYSKDSKDCRRIKFGYYSGNDQSTNSISIAKIVNPSINFIPILIFYFKYLIF